MQKIIVNNFGPIKHAEIEIRKFTIVIGEQASGKTYLSKLVYFFNKLPIELFDFIFFQDGRINYENLTTEILNKFNNEIFKSLLLNKQDFSVIFHYDTEAYVKISKKNNQIIIDSNILDDLQKISNHIISNKDNFQKKFAGSDGWEPKMFNDFSDFFFKESQLYDSYREVYIPASRALLNTFPRDITYDILRNPLLSDDFRVFIKRVERIKQEFVTEGGTFESIFDNRIGFNNKWGGRQLLALIQEILKAKYLSFENDERLYFDEFNFVTIENASSGQQESLRVLQDLFLLLVDEIQGFRAIEEPEAHLFPTAQKKLVEFMSIIGNATGSSLFISTHSPYILSAFNNLLFAKGVEKEFGHSFNEMLSRDFLPTNASWIDPDSFIAYSLKASGDCKEIFDSKTGMIDENYLDDVSMEIADEFNIMFSSYKKLKSTDGK